MFTRTRSKLRALRFFAVSAAAVTLPVLAGCSAGGGTSGSSSLPTTIKNDQEKQAAQSSATKSSTTYALAPTWASTISGQAADYVFVIPVFNHYPQQLVINGDVNGTLSIQEQSSPTACPSGDNDIVSVSPKKNVPDPHRVKINCNSGHEQRVLVHYTGSDWQYQHNGVPGQTQDCDAGCSAYASIDLYKGDYNGSDQTKLIQGDGPGATTNGNTTALATIDPLAISAPAYSGLVDANYYNEHNMPVVLRPSNVPLSVEVTEANINHITPNNQISVYPRQPSDGSQFGFNPYTSGSQFTTGPASLPVGATSNVHLPYNVGLDIITAGNGSGNLGITAPEPPGSQAGPGGFVPIQLSNS